MDPLHNFPFELVDVEKNLNSELLSYFAGQEVGYVKVGPKGYFVPKAYEGCGSQIYNMPLRTSDVFVVTYPRTGTTLSQELVWLVANDMDYNKAKETKLHVRFPFIDLQINLPPNMIEEMNNVKNDDPNAVLCLEQIAQMPSPRFIKSHLPLSLLPPALLDTAKVVYVARNPRDVAVSLYHHNRRFSTEGFTGDFKRFWNYFTRDLIAYTPFWEHLKEAWAARHHPNMLFIFYEDLVKDMPSEIRKVAKFFGKNLTEEQILSLCQHLNIDNFRANKSVNLEIGIEELLIPGEETFIRKGGSGGWCTYFDEQMTEEAEKWIADYLKGTDLKFPFADSQ